jgi:tRNA pseudouridine13 synthase
MILRRLASDFRVQEVLTPSRTASISPTRTRDRTHAVYELTKTSLTTPEATARLARALGVKPGALSHAGLKDKHAHTTQHVSASSLASVTPPQSVEQGALHARLIGWTDAPLCAKDIDHNHFTIIARDLTSQLATRLRARAALLSRFDEASTDPQAQTQPCLWFANFFGEQRFGSARHGQGFAAPLLIRGEFEAALRLLIATPARKDTGAKRTFTRLCATHWGHWAKLATECPSCPERRAIEHLARAATSTPAAFRDAFASLPMSLQDLCVDAYQSMLWNESVARYFRDACAADSITSSTDWGDLISPTHAWLQDPAQHDPSRLALLSATLPLPGPWMDLAASPPRLREAMLTTLASHHAQPASLAIPGLRRPQFGSPRRAILARAANFRCSDPSPDDLGRPARLKVTLDFSLPPGSYATVLLRLLEG